MMQNDTVIIDAYGFKLQNIVDKECNVIIILCFCS